MFEELSKVMELQKKMNEVFKNSPLDPADFEGTQEQARFQILFRFYFERFLTVLVTKTC